MYMYAQNLGRLGQDCPDSRTAGSLSCQLIAAPAPRHADTWTWVSHLWKVVYTEPVLKSRSSESLSLRIMRTFSHHPG